MLSRSIVLLSILLILIQGCEKTEKIAQNEDEYKNFVKKRQEKIVGVDIDALREALRKYPDFKSSIESGRFDPGQYRMYARQKNVDSMKMLTLFFVIKEIEDSVKVPTGQKYLEKKYKPKVIELVAKNLGLNYSGGAK